MALKSIVVALARGPSVHAVINGAAALAKRHQSHLLGLHVIDIIPFAGYMDGDLTGEVIAMQDEKLRADATQVEKAFRTICTSAGVDAQWCCEEGRTHHVIDQYARYCDLLCVSAPTATADSLASLPAAEELLFSAGRPVLVIPEGFDADSIGERVTIAWNGSREAAKAISNALPILARAQSVSLATVVDDHLDEAQASIIVADLSRYLALHGVTVAAQTVNPGEAPVGQFLHDWARDKDSDLLVMGGYGHARIREFVLGGVTRWSVRNSTIPVLMAH